MGYGPRGDQETAELFLATRQQTEDELLSKTPNLSLLPRDAWRVMWDALNAMRAKLVIHRIKCGPVLKDNISPRSLIKISPTWYLGPFHNSSGFSVVQLGHAYCPRPIGDVYIVNELLEDCRLEPRRVWHTLCIIDSVIQAEEQLVPYQLPKKERVSHVEAYERIKGWLTYEALKS